MQNDFFSLLHQEHELVARFIQDIDITLPERTTELEDRWTALKRALLPHIVAEENTFYTVLHDRQGTRDDALRGLDEHHAIEGLLFETNTIPLGAYNNEWFQHFKRLKDMISQHIAYEESTIFQDAAKVFGANELQEIMSDYGKAEEDAKSSMAGPGLTHQVP